MSLKVKDNAYEIGSMKDCLNSLSDMRYMSEGRQIPRLLVMWTVNYPI